MNTQIFESNDEFLSRPDKLVNGVTQSFADANPGWDKECGNQACWNCSYCSYCSRCSYCYGCYDCSYCSGCSGCSGCFDCFDCFDCFNCSRRSDRSDLTQSDLITLKPKEIPIIPNIHTEVLKAVNQTPDSLNIDTWHTCETTHCRAGWVVTLAGESGRELEGRTSTGFAAMQIYKASSPIRVYPPRFYDTKEVAMADIIRCAEEEAHVMV